MRVRVRVRVRVSIPVFNVPIFHSQVPHVQGHFEIWKEVFTMV